MYSIISKNEFITVIKKLCETNGIEDSIKQGIIKISQVLIEQNYFLFQDIICIQNAGLAMGAPTSSIFSEIYPQYIENTKFCEILVRHKIEEYFRYVDDILLMYKQDQTNIQEVLDNFNNLTPNIKFTVEEEKDNKINFLDITVAKDYDNLTFGIYRKPTATGVIIPKDSFPPKRAQNSSNQIPL